MEEKHEMKFEMVSSDERLLDIDLNGNGQDIVNNYVHEYRRGDKSVFGEGISPEDINVGRKGDDLILQNMNNSDKVTLQNVYKGASYYIGSVEFSDGTEVH